MYDRGAYVLDVDVNDGVYVRDEKAKIRERLWNQFSYYSQRVLETSLLNQAQQDHERKDSFQQDVHGENQNAFEHVKGQGKGATKALRAHER